MRPNERFDFDVYLSFHNYRSFFDKENIVGKEPIWSEKDIIYNHNELNKRELNVTIPVNDKIRNNKTLYLHMQVTMKNPFYLPGVNDQDYDRLPIREDPSENEDDIKAI
jgi:hypothetical protein